MSVGKASLGRWHLNADIKGEKHAVILVQMVLEEGTGQCKGPEAEACPGYLKKSMGRRVEGGGSEKR